jgi:hypothetical protein
MFNVGFVVLKLKNDVAVVEVVVVCVPVTWSDSDAHPVLAALHTVT